MASTIPQFYSDYTFGTDFCNFPAPLLTGGSNGGAMWGQESFHLFDDGSFDIKPQESDFVPSVAMMHSYPERLGVSDMVVPSLPELSTELYGIAPARVQNFGGGHGPAYVCDFGVECSRLVSDFRPDFSTTSGDNLGGTQGKPILGIEESNTKVGQYTVGERKERILRYLKKRNQRNFNKTIKYACRKTLADRRVRVRGRFARNNELCDQEELGMKKNNNDPQESKGLYYADLVQNQSDDEWLQEAMKSLMYLPYIA